MLTAAAAAATEPKKCLLDRLFIRGTPSSQFDNVESSSLLINSQAVIGFFLPISQPREWE
jgi:hypothetical protein